MNILRRNDLNTLLEEALTTASPERLQNLLEIAEKHDDRIAILQAIMTNPNTPPEMLLKLGADFPQELLEHPIFNLLLLENLFDLVKTMPDETQVSLLKLDNLPFSIGKIIVQYSNENIRFKIAENRNTPVRILEILAHDTNVYVRARVAYNRNTPIRILEILAHDTDKYVRRNVANNPNTPVTILEILAHDTDSMVRKNVANNSNTPVTILVRILEILAHDTNAYVRGSVAKHPNTPVRILEILAHDTNSVVRGFATSNLINQSRFYKS